jgi:hypothetical protein
MPNLTITSEFAATVLELPPGYHGCTWLGLAWQAAPTERNTFDGVLVSAAFQFQREDGTAALTLRSTDPGEIELVNADPRQWSVIVKPRILDIPAGNYSWALETTDEAGVQQPRAMGIIVVHSDPTA